MSSVGRHLDPAKLLIYRQTNNRAYRLLRTRCRQGRRMWKGLRIKVALVQWPPRGRGGSCAHAQPPRFCKPRRPKELLAWTVTRIARDRHRPVTGLGRGYIYLLWRVRIGLLPASSPRCLPRRAARERRSRCTPRARQRIDERGRETGR